MPSTRTVALNQRWIILLLCSIAAALLTQSSNSANLLAQARLNTHYETDGARVVVNFPAYRLYLYNGKELVKSYRVGVGMNDFKPVFGEMEATQIVYNPSWTPTGSAWSRGHKAMRPGEAGNPLGRVKLPLYSLYLIHGGAHPSDIGRSVSHGCVRMLNADALDLMQNIAEIQNGAEGLAAAKRAAKVHGRSVPVRLDSPVVVDFRYDLAAVNDGKISIYPDIYHFGADRQAALESALKESGLSWDGLTEQQRNRVNAALKRRPNQSQVIALTESETTRHNKHGIVVTDR